MKIIAAVLCLLCSVLVSGQNIHVDVDKFSGDTSYSSGFFPIDGGYKERVIFEGVVKNGQLQVYLSLSTDDIHCFKQDSKVMFLYENGLKDTLYSSEKLNCKGLFKFKIDKEDFPKINMQKSPISTIRFFSTEGYFDIELDKSEQVFISRKKWPTVLTELSIHAKQ